MPYFVLYHRIPSEIIRTFPEKLGNLGKNKLKKEKE